jgi:branched-chain amino acid transport system ATP-binding protein
MSGESLDCRGVRIAYERDTEIVRGVDLRVADGSITTIIGPNGAGKSTLLKGIAGVAPMTGGELTFGANSLVGLSPSERLARGLAFVPQERSAFDEMTVEENLRMGAWQLRRERRRVVTLMDEVLSLFPLLAERRRRAAGDLSGGQRKLLEVARGLMSEPKLLLLDEPTAGLAPHIAHLVYEQMVVLRDTHGVTILLVDQNVREALEVSDVVHVIALGQNAASGSAEEIGAQLDTIVRDWMTHSAAS